MKQCLVLKLVLMLVLISIPIAVMAAEPVPPPKAADMPIDVQFSDTPLPAALDAMFKGSGKSYVLDPGLQQLQVTALLKNVSLNEALGQVLKAAGAAYYVDGQGVYQISAKANQQQNAPMPVPVGSDQQAAGSAVASTSPTQVIDVKYLNAGDIADVIRMNTPGVNVAATTGNKLILSGTQKGIDTAVQTVGALDSQDALRKPVRLKVTAKITVGTAKGPKAYEASTESVGAEGMPSLLNLQTVVPYYTSYSTVTAKGQVIKQSTPNFTTTSLVNATITPSVGPDTRISLVGRGHFSCPLSNAPGSELSKDFDVAASVLPGKPFTVAAGSVHLQIGNVDFVVTITATPEQGYVPSSSLMNSQPQGGYGSVQPSMTNPGNRGNYGGSSGGYGGGSRSW